MKNDCPVIRDLYVLYKENELSEETRIYVEEHLKICSECRYVYENETGFPDVYEDVKQEKVSKKVDNKIRLHMKFRLLKGFMVIAVVSLLIYGFFSFTDNRRNLRYDLQQIQHSIDRIKFSVEGAGEKAIRDYDVRLYHNLDMLEQMSRLALRDLNRFERKKLNNTDNKLYFNYKIEKFANILQDRKFYGNWSKTDQKAYEKAVSGLNGIVKIMQEPINNLYNTVDKQNMKPLYLFKFVDMSEIAKSYGELNRIVASYINYNKLPGDIDLLTDKQLLNILKEKLGTKDITMSISDIYRQNIKSTDYTYDIVEVNLKDENFGWSLNVDAVTGNIYQMHSTGRPFEGEIMPLKRVKDNIDNIVKKLFTEEFEYNIKYMGENYNYNSNLKEAKVYSFNIKPLYKGYEIDTGANRHILNINVYNAMPHSFYFGIPKSENMGTDKITISPQESYNAIEKEINENESIEDYKFIKTVYKYSHLTARYELMHKFQKENSSRKIYVNASVNPGVVAY